MKWRKGQKFKWLYKRGKKTSVKIWKRKGHRHKIDCAKFPENSPCFCDANKNLDWILKKLKDLK